MHNAVKIVVSRRAKKQLEKIPEYIYRKYLYWVDLVKMVGTSQAKKYKGFHDEPLRGKEKARDQFDYQNTIGSFMWALYWINMTSLKLSR